MSVVPLRLVQPILRPVPAPALPVETTPVRRKRVEGGAFALFLLEQGAISPDGLVHMLAEQAGRPSDLGATLLAQGIASEPAFTKARAAWHGLTFVDPIIDTPDIRLIDRLGVLECLKHGLLPWRAPGGVTVVLTDRPESILRHRARIEQVFGLVTFALAPRHRIETALQGLRYSALGKAALSRTPEELSCRSLPARPGGVGVIFAAAAMAAMVLPGGVFGLITLVALTAMLASMGMKTLALFAALRPTSPAAPPAAIAHLPVVSLIVALYKEADIAPRLVRRLGRIDYPRNLLEVILAVEEDDHATRRALANSGLPPWMRVIVVPHGSLKTKPRALNHALSFCRGSIVGVYDAEDAPAPGQIRDVVHRFHQRGAEVACLQGALDFYNPATNWMARCFTMEYASWFRVILPGLERLGLPIPLGGTTLFFRRKALEQLGAWDAHNVTEDADLGIRLYRQGYRTEVIETTTEEEANCRPLPWVRQRSRWIKGYMMTWRLHMRSPRQLWHDLGPRRFVAFQVLILGSVLHALTVPALISFWLLTLGLPHPLAAVLPWPLLLALVGMFLASAAINLTLGYIALKRRARPMNPLWLLTLGFYHALATLAAVKALWELVFRPFYWDKTQHGKHDPAI
ncbi:MAG: glycosyl transferase [Cereibacter sphaeroides]|uniref:Glycosyl transferase n=1 Tax=Cereibacter sphaeroides TaxID=1063 RepID=A0A2W5S7G9_CERSP|nr:MAG: glycosyl transferase [Cereibacter sphaeroides]